MEIERKWLVDKKELENLVVSAFYQERIEQYYLNGPNDEWVIRLRKADNEHFLTLKNKGMLSREEIEVKILKQIFENHIRLAKTKLSKTRHMIEIDPDKLGVFEVDVYDDYNFITCEVEFETEEEANAFVAPGWCIKDVTEDPKYKNINLAK
jgi:CYTH domain-containing protein